MKRLENKKKPWKAKRMRMFHKERPDEPRRSRYDWGAGRRITGWQKQCGYLATFLKESKEPPKSCKHCRVSTMRPILGTRPWTAKGVCPESLDGWGRSYCIWKPIEEPCIP